MLKRFSLQTAVRRLAFLWAKSNLQMCFFSSVLESVFEKCELVDNIKNSGVFTYKSRFLASFEKFQDEIGLLCPLPFPAQPSHSPSFLPSFLFPSFSSPLSLHLSLTLPLLLDYLLFFWSASFPPLSLAGTKENSLCLEETQSCWAIFSLFKLPPG